MYHLFECQHYIIRFLSSSCQLEFSSLEVKHDRFRNRDEGTWQKPLEILSTKDRWSELLTYVTELVQPEETSRWKSINTHRHTHHKHTHTHTHGVSILYTSDDLIASFFKQSDKVMVSLHMDNFCYGLLRRRRWYCFISSRSLTSIAASNYLI